MPHLLKTLLGLVGVILLVVVALVVLANFTGPRTGGEVRMLSTQAPVDIGVGEDGHLHIEAASTRDLFAGLGYAHALRHAWPMTLWQVTAIGRRSETARDSTALALDHLVATLGIATDARRAYRALPDSLRAYFDAYVEGVNTSFARNRLVRADEFIVLDVEHRQWEPWHPIAIEMLMAYLAAASEVRIAAAAEGRRLPGAVRDFIAADSLLRETLSLDGLQHSLAYVASDQSGTSFYHRLVYGRSGMPLVQMVELRVGQSDVLAASIPGTVALLGGFAADRAWAVVPSPNAVIGPSSATPPPPSYDRIVRHDGGEMLVATRRTRGVLFIEEGDVFAPPADTLPDMTPNAVSPEEGQPDAGAMQQPDLENDVDPEIPAVTGRAWWTLNWQGIGGGSDIRAWLALLEGTEPSIELFSGGGLIYREGGLRLFGNPAYTAQAPGGVVIGGSSVVDLVAARLAAQDYPLGDPQSAGADTYSAWAARLAPPLVRAIGHPDSVDVRIRDATAFLQGWNYHYEADAIAPSIFEHWMRVHLRNARRLPDADTLDLARIEVTDTVRVRFADHVAEQVAEAREEGRRPPSVVDTLAARPELADSMVVVTRTRVEDPHDLRVLKHALHQAVEELEAAFGRPGPDWQWQRVQEGHLRLPGRTDEPGAQPRGRRYRDVPLRDGGHPTAIQWGSSRLFDDAVHPATWSAWTSTAAWDQVFILAREPFREALHERYADHPEPTPVRIWNRGATIERTIRLLPPA